ncbi:MAG: universal stress protein [Longimicrobiales bacterium]
MSAALTPASAATERVSAHTGRFTVLVPVGFPASGPGLLSLAATLVPAGLEADIRPLHVATGERWRSVDESAQDALGLLLGAGADSDLVLEPVVRSGTDVAAEIVSAVRELDAQLVVLGWQRPTLNRTLISGTVAKVMQETDAEVIVHYDRTPRPWRRLLVPYLYGDHDRAAIGVAMRLAGHEAESVTILHVVEPDEDPGGSGPFRDTVDGMSCEVKVVPAADPRVAAAEEARTGGYDALVVGTSRAWGLAPAFLGMRHELLARETDASMLIVRAARA